MTQNFTVLEIKKFKKGIVNLGKHYDRSNIPDNADPNRVKNNEYMPGIDRTLNLFQRIEKRLSEAEQDFLSVNQKKLIRRKDEVKAISFILSGSRDGMAKIEKEQRLQEWKHKNLEWIQSKFGHRNIVEFALHLDELTPHIHCVVTPITPKHRISAKHWLNGGASLRNLQTEYANAMQPFGLGRGVMKKRTKHTTTSEWYTQIEKLEHLKPVVPKQKRFEPFEKYAKRVEEAFRPAMEASVKISEYKAFIRKEVGADLFRIQDMTQKMVKDLGQLRNNLWKENEATLKLLKIYDTAKAVKEGKASNDQLEGLLMSDDEKAWAIQQRLITFTSGSTADDLEMKRKDILKKAQDDIKRQEFNEQEKREIKQGLNQQDQKSHGSRNKGLG